MALGGGGGKEVAATTRAWRGDGLRRRGFGGSGAYGVGLRGRDCEGFGLGWGEGLRRHGLGGGGGGRQPGLREGEGLRRPGFGGGIRRRGLGRVLMRLACAWGKGCGGGGWGKEPDHGKHEEKYFFGSNNFGASPEKTDSPRADNKSQKNSPFTFEDSVPGTPISRAGNSPRYSIGSRDPFADSFSRYDSFTTHGRDSSPVRENLTRFDSISSTRGFDHSSKYSFDDSDPSGSSGPFKASSETPKKGSE
ncbi:hypothetical protein Salat_0574000 [Sesamum alatum]|uniref:Uncharacterized protein n=1 Tax=Sesamum alatum TaxID=300844 RepID=A0AAE1YQW1_9LAMI|nr:hypothetical protein Salat_0574000 [Sesamum alatum]